MELDSLSGNPGKFAPIALFAYNRPWHLQQTVEALKKNSEAAESDLYIFSDGPKTEQVSQAVSEVRQYIKTVTGFKSVNIVERAENYGLAKSIVDGVSFVCNRYGRAIVLEDDLVTAPFFLKFMNDGLNYYADDSRVASIHGYMFPVRKSLPRTFFVRGANCLGWATWKRAWDLYEHDAQKLYNELIESGLVKWFDMDGGASQLLKWQVEGKINSWAIRWQTSIFLENGLTLFPAQSLVRHIGNDGSGTNFGVDDQLDVELDEQPVAVGGIPVEESIEARHAIAKFYGRTVSWPRRINRKIRSIVKWIASGMQS